jgi:uncharacterized radical SAM superfamily Fe-S cluster-containing enzyme
MERKKTVSVTESLCPICMREIDAQIYTRDNKAYMEKYCPEHGFFETIIWKGKIPIQKWVREKERAYIKNPSTAVNKGCPFDCGLCIEHRQHTCTALIEVTKRCNLYCAYCFANSYAQKGEDPSLDRIKFQYESVMKVSGKCNIQLSGGEPTIRDDLPEIIRLGTDLGFTFIQVNTNGIRLGEDESYVKELKAAGLSSIYLQFDGTKNSIYRKLRGKELLEIKRAAVENCKKYGIAIILVPTLVPGVNTDNIGEIIDFALEHTPAVRGVHFQPVSYFGRVPGIPSDEDRITLPEVMEEIEIQTGGRIKTGSFKPPGCENALCSFHGSYLLDDGKNLVSTTKRSCCCSNEKAEEGAVRAKEYVSRNWSYPKEHIMGDKQVSERMSDWDRILYHIHKNTFSISAMAFQDIWNLDLERLRDCCIHVVSPDGRLIPFCIYNITDFEGRYLYRR